MAKGLYAAIDLKYWRNPKIRRLGREGAILLQVCILESRELLTDGFIDDAQIDMLIPIAWATQETVELLVQHGRLVRVEGGYQIHDYEDWNETTEVLESKSQARRQAGSLGGKAKASKTLANAIAKSKQKPSTNTITNTNTNTLTNTNTIQVPFTDVKGSKVPKGTLSISETWNTVAGQYQQTRGSGKLPVLNDKRQKLLQAALKVHSLDEILDAMQGWYYDDFIKGDSPDNSTFYAEIDYILRMDAKGDRIEKYCNMWRNPPLVRTVPKSDKQKRDEDAMRELVEHFGGRE